MFLESAPLGYDQYREDIPQGQITTVEYEIRHGWKYTKMYDIHTSRIHRGTKV